MNVPREAGRSRGLSRWALAAWAVGALGLATVTFTLVQAVGASRRAAQASVTV